MAWLAPFLFAGASLFGWGFYRLPQQGRATRLHNAALQSLLTGKDDEAVALLDDISPRELRRGGLGVSVHTQRAMIAMHSGDAAKALALTTAGLALPWSRVPWFRMHEELHRTKARALEAICHASLGHEREAESDAAVAESSIAATPDVLARASLARSIVLARQNDRRALAAHLQQTAGLMLQSLSPRERSLVRAFRRMARAQVRNVYREPARRDERLDGGFASWVGKLAPEAEAFAREAPLPVAVGEARDPSDAGPPSAVSNVRRAHDNAGKPMRRRMLALWVILVATFFGIWNALSPSSIKRYHVPAPSHEAPPDQGLPFTTYLAIFVVAVVAWVVLRVRTQRRQVRRLAQAELSIARGDVAGARDVLTALTRSMAHSVAAAAHLGLARLAERRARWNDALAECDAGIKKLLQSSAAKAMQADLLLPELMAARAFTLAAIGRYGEANAEMTVIASDYPAYVGMGAAEFRTGLLVAVREGDLPGARRVAMTRTPSLTLTLRDDMLADVVLAASTDMTADERERIDAELSDDAELRAWIDAVAPDLRRGARVQVAPAKPMEGTSTSDANALAEATAEADESVEGEELRSRERVPVVAS